MPEDDEENIRGPRELAGQYANHYRVGHNAFEFVIDFGQFYEGDEAERFHTRIITSPNYARELLKVLSQAIQDYEATFGPARDDH